MTECKINSLHVLRHFILWTGYSWRQRKRYEEEQNTFFTAKFLLSIVAATPQVSKWSEAVKMVTMLSTVVPQLLFLCVRWFLGSLNYSHQEENVNYPTWLDEICHIYLPIRELMNWRERNDDSVLLCIMQFQMLLTFWKRTTSAFDVHLKAQQQKLINVSANDRKKNQNWKLSSSSRTETLSLCWLGVCVWIIA